MKQDVYQRVTDKIVADLEKGELTWVKPWSGSNMDGKVVRPLRHNGVPYSGINVLMLWGAAVDAGFASPFWMTFKQAQELGAHVARARRAALSSMPIPSPGPRKARTAARRNGPSLS